MIRLQMEADSVEQGVYSDVIRSGSAPPWMKANRQTIELVERKVFNRHDFAENLRLAFTFLPRIRL